MDASNAAAPEHHILIVDDDLAVLEMLAEVVADAGYRVTMSTGALDGIALARQHGPDLILMDLQMPGIDGVQAVGRLKADPATRRIPVVALTAAATAGDVDMLVRAGCIGYVPKPITDIREFQATLDGFIQATRPRPHPGT